MTPDAQHARHDTLQTGLDLLDQGLSIFDADLRLVAWNRAFVRLLEFPEGMARVGEPFQTFIGYNAQRGDYGPGDPDEQLADRVRAARLFTTHDLERVRPNGQVLRIRGQPVPGHGFVTLYSDVTEQRIAERTIREQNVQLENRVAARTHELLRSEQRVRLIMDSIPALVAYFDRHRVYTYLNRGYRDWFGVDITRPELASAKVFLGKAVYAVVRPQVLRALAGETVSFDCELTRQDGRRLMVNTSLIPERAADGTVAGCFELSFDITEQRRSQELLARAQKLEALGQLTGGLAHDFNNILTVVIGNLAAVVDAHPRDRIVPEFVEPALDAARRGAELVKGLLTFARRQPLQAGAVEAGPLIAVVARLVRRSLPESLRLEMDVPAGGLWAWIDASQLEQALLNLVLNARDATPPDGRIQIRARAAVLDADAAATLQVLAGEYVCIDVTDSGSGMDAHTMEHMFEPFFTTKRPGSGTGLGMAMVYGFIRQSGGAIDVRSTPGEGSTISLWLPAAEGLGDTAAAPLGEPLPAAGQRGLALLVEDDAPVRRVVRRSLLELGYVVLEAESGPEALQILDSTPGIALLLSDVLMPGGIDGRELARRARDSGQVPRVLLMSGYAPGELQVSDVPLLAKPFSTAQLAALLDADVGGASPP